MSAIKVCLFAFAVAWAGVAQAQVPCGTWNTVLVPNAAGHGLASVSASSATDAWAVWKAVYHWDGSAWTPVSAPGLGNPDPLGYADTVLRKVAAVAPGDAWIVGYTAFLGTPQTLAEHWNGSKWTVVPSPVVSGGSEFSAVVAVGPNDAWAVGSRAGGLPEFRATQATFTAHWDGSHWSAVPSPNVSNRSHELLAVTAIASNDVWAVGSWRNIGEDYRSLILHWNGSSWAITPSPNYPGENILFGVSGTAANDVWAVGSAWDGVTARQIFLHWNGASWSFVTGPGGETAAAACQNDVLAMGPNDVWAVGSRIGHWNGTQWTLAPPLTLPGTTGMTLRSLARIGACEAWAVGGSFDVNLAERALSVRLGAAGGGATAAVGDSPWADGVALRVGPNPSRGVSVIQLALRVTQRVRVAIFDVGGRQVRELWSAPLPAGERTFEWDGRDAAGESVGPGVYFVTARAGGQSVTARALRLK